MPQKEAEMPDLGGCHPHHRQDDEDDRLKGNSVHIAVTTITSFSSVAHQQHDGEHEQIEHDDTLVLRLSSIGFCREKRRI